MICNVYERYVMKKENHANEMSKAEHDKTCNLDSGHYK